MEPLEKVRETARKHSMLSDNDHVLIGLSGGPDSVCLAFILDKLREDFNLSLSAVYIDHGLRPGETEKEREFCERLCDTLQIQFHFRSVNVKQCMKDISVNLQERARELRYAAFAEISDSVRADKTALGHNADDQAETVLMRLIRGSGRKGMTGIPPVRGRIIRPLIDIERSEIEGYLNDVLSQGFVVDTSNLKEEYTRNWIRNSLMGEMKKRNPAVVRDICRTVEILREEDEYLEVTVTKTLMRLISRKSDNSIELFLSPLATIEIPILRRVLRRAIDATKGLRGIRFVHIEDIINLIKEGKSGDRVHLPKDIRVLREYSLLKMTTEEHLPLPQYVVDPPCEIDLREAKMVMKVSIEEKQGDAGDDRSSICLDAGQMTFPLTVRARTAGDFFYPLGFGKKRKLQDFFVDEKIPREKRDTIPILLSGNDIIWIAGYRGDDRFKVTGKTEKYLKLQIRER